MKLPIYLVGQPVLREKAVEIDETYENLNELIENMFETMYSANGIGLAAPQIGKAIKLYIIDASPMAEDYPELEDFKRIFINPKIISKSEETIEIEEGCLSVPDIHEKVSRYSELTMEYLDENFKKKTEKFIGFQAIAVQHEYDHLDGIIFTDKLSPLRKRLLKSKLMAIAKGRVRTSYKVK